MSVRTDVSRMLSLLEADPSCFYDIDVDPPFIDFYVDTGDFVVLDIPANEGESWGVSYDPYNGLSFGMTSPDQVLPLDQVIPFLKSHFGL